MKQLKKEMTRVFTDGSCSKNGYTGAIAGYAVYIPDYPLLNISGRVPGSIQTNNRGEMYAIITALELAIENKLPEPIEIVSDSKYSINCATVWLKKWQGNDYKSASGKQVLNLDLIKRMEQLLEQLTVSFTHVNSHQKEPSDKNTLLYTLWHGNNIVDSMAQNK